MTRAALSWALTGLLLLALPEEGAAQLRRDTPVQPVSELRRGDFLIGVGGGYGARVERPLSGLGGHLLTLGNLHLAYALAPRAVVEIRGDLYQRLAIRDRGDSAVPLHPDVDGGSTADVGDFRVGLTLAPLRLADRVHAGGRVEVTLPNTNEERGIGTNTTDLKLSLLAGYAGPRLGLTGDVGVAILEAPLEHFSQNDVVVYSAEALYRAREDGALRLMAGVDGRASTRGRVPLGTEDRGELHLGAEVGRSRWAADLRLGVGYVPASPDWSVRAGVSFSGAGRAPRGAPRPPR